VFQAGDKIQNGGGEKAEVLQVSKNGQRIRIAYWSPLGREPRLMKMWTWADGWSKR
jgi:hypothetical protein